MERITLVIAVVALLLGGWGLVGGGSSPIGGPTRFPNSDLSAATITSNGNATFAQDVILTQGIACLDFFATSTATQMSFTFDTTGATSTHAGTVFFDFGSCQ